MSTSVAYAWPDGSPMMRADDPMSLLPTNPIPYQEIRPKLGTGDLVFLQTASTQGLLIEAVERLFGLPTFSHVGMVVKDSDLLLWDAPGGGHCFHDPYAAKHEGNRVHDSPVHPGCRVSVLDEVLGYYKTKTKPGVRGFWVRQLEPPGTDEKTDEQLTALRTFIDRVDGLPFPTEFMYTAMADNFIAGQKGMTMYFGKYFCSQLVADSYMHMGVLDMDARPPNAYAPAHFGLEATADFGATDPPRFVSATLGHAVFVAWDMPETDGTPCEQEAWSMLETA
jgi:hypothetical protein